MATFQIADSLLQPVFYNIDANVGQNSPNRDEDVALVTFLMRRSSEHMPLQADVRAAFAAVPLGRMSPELVVAVNTWARSRNQLEDGHVSVARSGVNYPYNAADGKRGYMIALLNWYTKSTNSSTYPRLDMMKECPAQVANLVKRSVVGT